VIVDPLLRRQRIVEQIDRVAAELGGRVVYPDALLDEVNNLVEWPMAIACSFERAFLRVPAEALMTTMETNQRFFPVLDAAGSLTENFIGVANVESSNPAEIRKGYERVIRPRFADAQFFYDEDRKTPLERLREALRQVTYQKDLGSLFEKCERVVVLARVIATNLGSDVGHAVRAAALCKCDLMTRMVGEFPELQGVMGRYYASSGEHPEAAEVAVALDEFYAPRFAGDRIATSRTGQVLAVAERLDTLAGIFAVGMKPSGNKDPFALRRAALGLARTLIEGQLELDLEALLREAVELIHPTAWGKSDAKAPDALGDIGERRRKLTDEIYEFVIERLRGYYADQGIGADIFDAVRAVEPATLTEFDQRLHAVLAFTQLPESSSLAAANKRIGNILKQSAFAGTTRVDGALLQAGAEQALHAAVQAAATEIDPLVDKRNFIDAFKRLAALREPVDAFFDGVMVLVEDPALRHNRLALLAGLRRMFLRIADISLLQSGE
jgi:glycyl-tRNA synthetase beta chain